MTVIPFVIEGGEITVVSTKEKFDAAGGMLKGDVVLIKNLDQDQVNPEKVKANKSSNISYDLRVGREYRDLRNLGKNDLDDGDFIKLLPGAVVIIETHEEVSFPRTRFGHLIPKTKLLMQGISNTSSKIDPGFDGRLSITLFNLGANEITLKKYEPFCTLYLLDVQTEGLIHREKEKPPTPGARNLPLRQKFRNYMEMNQVSVSVLNSIATFLVGCLTIVLLASQCNQETTADTIQNEDALQQEENILKEGTSSSEEIPPSQN